jgi:uncharacterized protein YcbK (DUF882 family)
MKHYFDESEFECKCGCGLNNVNQALIEDLNVARHIAGIPFVITSGSRCEAHNKNSGGSRTSSHLGGYAADIRADDSEERFKVLEALITAGFKRIGIAKHFIHVDNDTRKPQGITWLYR